MSLFSKNPLSRDQMKKIMADANCSRATAISRAKTAIENGMDIDYFVDQQFYKASCMQILRYMKRPAPRKYVEALSGQLGLSDYEIYRQMRHARSEYKISYSIFAKKKLLNASPKQLEDIRKLYKKKSSTAVSQIANSLNVTNDEAQAIVNRIRSKFGYGAKEIYTMRLYTMTDDEIAEVKSRTKKRRKENIAKIQEKTGWSEAEIRAHISRCNIDFGIDTATYICCRCYELDDSQLALCGNMADSKLISAKYNKGHSKLLYNKVLFNETYKEYIGRKFWTNRDTSFEEFKEFADGLNEFFCKPIDSSIGRGTYKYDLAGKDLKDVYDYFMSQPKYLIEECVTQHPEMAKFNPESINTVRLFTILDNDEYDAFACFVRFGLNDFIDNFSSGGIACAVDPKTGVIITNATNKEGEEFETHPVSGIKFKGFQIPNWDKVLERTEQALRLVEGVNYVGWDIAIQEDDVVFIEGNSAPDLGIQQAIFAPEGHMVRPEYFKYVGLNAYDDMINKVIETAQYVGIPQTYAINRLIEASKGGFDYEYVRSEEICRMNPKQIKKYSSNEDIRARVDEVAKGNHSTIGEAYLRMQNANDSFGISFAAFSDNDLFDASEAELEEFANAS